jgi:hypothetical protein
MLSVLLLILLLVALLLSAGCLSGSGDDRSPFTTATAAPAATMQSAAVLVTLPSPTLPPAETAAAETPELSKPSTVTTTAAPVPAPTRVEKVYDATGDPRIIILQFEKSYFNHDLPDCGMRQSFPEAAADPEYGLISPAPRLVAYSEKQMVDFLRANAKPYATEFRADPFITRYIEPDSLGGTPCAGAIASPTWNFVLINATIMGRNARPAEYAIGFDVRSKGKVIAQVRADRNMTLDTPEIFALFVPVRTDETALFDSVELVFAKKK